MIKIKKQELEKEIEEINDLYRKKMIDSKIYLKQVIPLMDKYAKCEDLTTKEKLKLTGLRGLLKTLRVML